jgi:hypothetical protein
MATVQVNPIINGLSGMLGRTIVFKNLRGKTIVTSYPRPPKKQSEQQRTNRSKFRDAAFYAQTVLLDEEKKAYYQKKAKELKLPNAYTAAITDYMRSPQLKQVASAANETTYVVRKKDFDIPRVEIATTEGDRLENKTLKKADYNEWEFTLSTEDLQAGIQVNATDNIGRKRCALLTIHTDASMSSV